MNPKPNSPCFKGRVILRSVQDRSIISRVPIETSHLRIIVPAGFNCNHCLRLAEAMCISRLRICDRRQNKMLGGRIGGIEGGAAVYGSTRIDIYLRFGVLSDKCR
jgi:hypothetical protein